MRTATCLATVTLALLLPSLALGQTASFDDAVCSNDVRNNFTISDDDLARLNDDGFTILEQHATTFGHAYEQIFAGDLPVYVTADSILYALHPLV